MDSKLDFRGNLGQIIWLKITDLLTKLNFFLVKIGFLGYFWLSYLTYKLDFLDKIELVWVKIGFIFVKKVTLALKLCILTINWDVGFKVSIMPKIIVT